ncbi:MAG TPA: cupin domain-containing protein [Streptosporangiaceae bacterium]
MTAGTVVTADRAPAREAGRGATLRTLIDTGQGAPGLVRTLAELDPAARLDGEAAGAGELWFVLAGTGQLDLPGQPPIALRPDRGVLLPPGVSYQVSAGPSEGLRIDRVALPGPPGGSTAPASRDFAGCAVEVTGDREFRVLFGPGQGCAVATQFVGEIPPGRAPGHSHPYDEVVLILAGRGVAHIGGAEYPLAPGTCAHLPPGLVHCLENTGQDTLRVLGVFHPADSPAAKLTEDR